MNEFVDQNISSQETGEDLDRQLVVSEKKAKHKIKLWALTTCASLAFFVVVVYTLHLILPEGWRWLSPSEVQHIERAGLTIIVGVISTLATGYFLTSHN